MKLNIVPARTGLVWVKLGITTFFRQPLAFAGLFFMFMALVSIATLVPYVGSALALALLPAVTLGLIAATLEASKGKFPMPTLLITAFRAGRQQARAMLTLGAFYAAGFLAIMGISTLFDGGKFARLYLLGGKITQDLVAAPDFQLAMWVSTALYLPLSMLFWHAPALVHWYQVPIVKSLFFSAVGVLRNLGAYLIYFMGWMMVTMIACLALLVLSSMLGNVRIAAGGLLPVSLAVATMVMASLWPTFRDCFYTDDAPAVEEAAP